MTWQKVFKLFYTFLEQIMNNSVLYLAFKGQNLNKSDLDQAFIEKSCLQYPQSASEDFWKYF